MELLPLKTSNTNNKCVSLHTLIDEEGVLVINRIITSTGNILAEDNSAINEDDIYITVLVDEFSIITNMFIPLEFKSGVVMVKKISSMELNNHNSVIPFQQLLAKVKCIVSEARHIYKNKAL